MDEWLSGELRCDYQSPGEEVLEEARLRKDYGDPPSPSTPPLPFYFKKDKSQGTEKILVLSCLQRNSPALKIH